MYFDSKNLDQISNDEILSLVTNHVEEQAFLEFKASYDHKDESTKLEILKDITAFANAAGGYIFVGIRDDGRGRAQKFESLNFKVATAMRQSISDLCNDYIDERIDGLEIETRTINGENLLLIRIPPSIRAPHMVTYKNNTYFCRRYRDGKREMTATEIRSSFNDDLINRRLNSVEALLGTLNNKRRPASVTQVFGENDVANWDFGDRLAKFRLENFAKEAGSKQMFYLAITPLSIESNVIETDSEVIEKLVRSAPGSRFRGWNISNLVPDKIIAPKSLSIGSIDHNLLTILSTGHMEFIAPINQSFCALQSEDEFARRPRLYPYAVVEYPVSFFRLYRTLIDQLEIKESEFRIIFSYRNIKGDILPPYAPPHPMFYMAGYSKSFPNDNYCSDICINDEFQPDQVAYSLLKEFYGTFGLEAQAIPFFEVDTTTFKFQ